MCAVLCQQVNTDLSARTGRPARQPAPSSGIRGLADLHTDEEDDEDSDEGNEYYAGGEKSGQVCKWRQCSCSQPNVPYADNLCLGQVVKGAPKGPPGDVGAYFDRARQAGARQGTEQDLPGASQPSTGSAFQGASHTLAGA